MKQALRPELISKCLELIYYQASNAYTSSIAAGLILAGLFWGRVPALAIGAWALSYAVMIGLRHVLGMRFKAASRGPDDANRWLSYYVIAVFVSGCIWGAYGVYLANHADPYRLTAVVLALGALVSGGVTAYAVSRLAFLAFSIPTLVPIGIWLLAQGADSGGFLGGLVIIWLIFMYFAAMRFRTFAIESLGYQFDNVNLVKSLASERDKANELAAQLKKLSSLDGLTNIPNRRAFDEEFEVLLEQAKQNRTPITLIICDVDYFKPYNDGYGHMQGDVCLRSVAGQLQAVAQSHGALAARIGGEEFAVIYHNADANKGRALAEALREGVEQLKIAHQYSKVRDTVTGSFGVCSVVPQKDTACSDLLQRADEALYQAKHSGRNKVQIESRGENRQVEATT